MANLPDAVEASQGFSGRQRVILGLILAGAACLRFIGIDHHLWRGTGAFDEGNNFVAAVLGMWTMHSPDPHPYSGYAGFLNWMFFLPMGLGERLFGEPGAFLGGRVVIAAFSVLNVLLMALVVERRAGATAALFGAALLAASRGEVSSSHWMTADILVVTAFLAILLVRSKRARGPSPELITGAVLGAAIAAKYTALLLAPVAAVETFRREGVKAVVRVAGFTVLFFVLAAPFAVRNMLAPQNEQGAGLLHPLRSYYTSMDGGPHFGRLGDATAMTHVNMGSLALLLAFLSPLLVRRRSDLLSPIVLVLTSEAVLAPADMVYPRHALPASAAYAVLAALAFDGLWKRFTVSRLVVGLSAVLLITQPLPSAYAVTAGYASPPEIDRAADWIEAHLPPGSRIATSLERFQLMESYEVRVGAQVRQVPEHQLGYFDLVVLAGPEATRRLTGCREVARFTDVGNEDQALVLKAPCGPQPSRVVAPASVFPQGTESVWDRVPKIPAHFGEGAVEFGAKWREPIEVAAIHLTVGDAPGDWPQRLQVSLLDRGGEWRLVEPVVLRPGQRRKQTPPYGQIYVLTGHSGEVFGVRFERPRGGEFSVTGVTPYGLPNP